MIASKAMVRSCLRMDFLLGVATQFKTESRRDGDLNPGPSPGPAWVFEKSRRDDCRIVQENFQSSLRDSMPTLCRPLPIEAAAAFDHQVPMAAELQRRVPQREVSWAESTSIP